jgi:hypothetical protein
MSIERKVIVAQRTGVLVVLKLRKPTFISFDYGGNSSLEGRIITKPETIIFNEYESTRLFLFMPKPKSISKYLLSAERYLHVDIKDVESIEMKKGIFTKAEILEEDMRMLGSLHGLLPMDMADLELAVDLFFKDVPSARIIEKIKIDRSRRKRNKIYRILLVLLVLVVVLILVITLRLR